MKKLISMFLLACVLGSAILSCGGNGGGSADTTAAADPAVTETAADETTLPSYDYPDVDLGGYTARYLNSAAVWEMYIYLDFEEMTGDALDDTVYTRNRAVEQKLNFNMKVTEEKFDDLDTRIQTSVLAGSDDFDACYVPDRDSAPLVTGGLFYNLHGIPELRLDEEWWDQPVIDGMTVYDKLFYATGDLNLMAFDGTWCLFFNKAMMADLGLDEPYDLVEEGRWTLDALYSYMKPAANLNGDDDFTLTVNSNQIFGLSAFYNSVTKMLFGCGIKYVDKNDKGELTFMPEMERFFKVCDKIAPMLGGNDGAYANATTGAVEKNSYLYLFMNERALFLAGEIKAGLQMRANEVDFGLVPYPKFDEQQEGHHSNMVDRVLVFCIPTTNPDPSKIGIITDALSGESVYTTLPVYFDTHVSTKGLRDERSIDMLAIIRATRDVDMSVPYNWCASLNTGIQNLLLAGNSSVASTVESARSAVEQKIADTMEIFAELN